MIKAKIPLFLLIALGVYMAIPAAALAEIEEGEFHAEEYPAHIVGENREATNAFTAGGGSIECSESTYTSELTESTSTLVITPVYAGCQDNSGRPVTITQNGCAYKTKLVTGLEEGEEWIAQIELECPEEQNPVIHTYTDGKHTTVQCTQTVVKEFTLHGGFRWFLGIPYFWLDFGFTYKSLTHGQCSFGFTLELEGELHSAIQLEGTEENKISIE